MQDKEVFVIFGPTASGKSDLAKQISTKLDSPIINFDSLQVYKQLRILSSRPSSQDEKLIDHRLYGIIDGNENCTVAKWLNLAKIEVHPNDKMRLSARSKENGDGRYFPTSFAL